MTDITTKVREHYSATDLTDRIKSALATTVPEEQKLTVAKLAPLDQFHTRGILATTELAEAAELAPSTRVLDLGCGIGGPARYLAATFGCNVIGVDLSPQRHRRGHLSDGALRTVRPHQLPDWRRTASAFRGRSLRYGVPAARGDEHRGPGRSLYGGQSHPDAQRPVRYP